MTLSKQLLPNPNFLDGAKGWLLENAVSASIGRQTNCVELKGNMPEQDPWSAASLRLKNFPTNRKLYFSCYLLCATGSQVVDLRLYTFDEAEDVVDAWITQTLAVQNKWIKFEATFYTSKTAREIGIWIVNAGDKSVYVSRGSLRGGKPVTPNSLEDCKNFNEEVTSVIEVNYAVSVEAMSGEKAGSVFLPVPGLYREQFPLTFEVSTVPKSALLDYEVCQREDGLNWLCKVDVKVLGPVRINRKSIVLVKGRKKHPLRKTTAAAPKAVAQWLMSTVCVQSDDPEIRAKSLELTKGAEDVGSCARAIIEFTSENRGRDDQVFNALDARKALACGGYCTSRANLAAALLRAKGIPARTVAHIPVWYGWMYEHWLTEYWHPGEGWVWLEPSVNQYEPAPNSLVILAVSGIIDEEKSLDPVYLRCIMPGAPYLAGHLLSRELDNGWETATNYAVELGRINGTDAQLQRLFKAALKAFVRVSQSNFASARSTRQSKEILLAIQNGSAQQLAVALTKSKQ